jgi:hypothetical protein
MSNLLKQTGPEPTVSDESTVRDPQKAARPRITLTDRLRSGYHRIWYEATQALRWSRGTLVTGHLSGSTDCDPAQSHAITSTSHQGTRRDLWKTL